MSCLNYYGREIIFGNHLCQSNMKIIINENRRISEVRRTIRKATPKASA